MADLSSIRVLVVDDEPSICRSLADFLEDWGFKVSLAESAEKALKIIEKKPHNVAIVDLRLTGMSGDAMIPKAFKIRPSMKFLIHTGSVGFRLSRELRKIGMRQEHVFFKPQPDLNVLVKAVKDLLKDNDNAVSI